MNETRNGVVLGAGVLLWVLSLGCVTIDAPNPGGESGDSSSTSEGVSSSEGGSGGGSSSSSSQGAGSPVAGSGGQAGGSGGSSSQSSTSSSGGAGGGGSPECWSCYSNLQGYQDEKDGGPCQPEAVQAWDDMAECALEECSQCQNFGDEYPSPDCTQCLTNFCSGEYSTCQLN